MKNKLTALMLIFGIMTSASVVPAIAAPDNPISGNWVTERIQGHKVNSEVKSTLNIADDYNISGNAGCNNYMGGMAVSGTNIEMKPRGSTMMACPPAQMEQDSNFHKALQSVVKWELRKDKLILINKKNHEVLRLSRAAVENNN